MSPSLPPAARRGRAWSRTALDLLGAIALAAAAHAQIGGSGWTPLAPGFNVQWPYNLAESSRYTDTAGIYHLWVYNTDDPFQEGSTTLPRTEQRFEPDYTSGEIQYQAAMMVPSDTSNVCIMQVHTGDAEEAEYGSTAFMLFWYSTDGGSVWDYDGTELVENLSGTWFQVNVDHNVATNVITAWINDVRVWTGPAHDSSAGAGDFYLKDGVYMQTGGSTEMENYIQDIQMWTSAGTEALGSIPSLRVTAAAPGSAVAAGSAVTLTASATTSAGSISYQWLLNAVPISGATSASYALTATSATAGVYTVVASNLAGTAQAAAGTLAIIPGPTITGQPVAVTLAAGQTASFHLVATGTGTVRYQWDLNGAAVIGGTDAYLLVTPVSSANAGSYTCIATDSTGSTTSGAATLTLSTSTDLGRLTNVSVRTNCGTGSANIIAGFVLGGSGNTGSAKSLLVRADGPELAGFGVSSTLLLPDPGLQVFNTTDNPAVSVGQNTGWCVPTTNENNVIAADTAVYAFPLTTNSASSAVVLSLPPDQYTENVTGASGDTGIALAEIYDVTNATETYSPSLPRLINVSARANVASGAGNLIAGFSIGGSTDETVLVRGTGPGLAEFSLTGLLQQPTLAVYQTTNSTDTLMATNTGWDEDPVLASAASSVYAFAQTSSADCSLLVTLSPGTYTANLNSGDGTSGLALVEVYEIP